MHLSRITLLAMLFTLTGCVSLSIPQGETTFTSQSITTRQAQLAQLRQWHMQGAFSVQQQQQAQLANFSWQQNNLNEFTIRVSSSLNVYNLLLTGKHGTFTFNDHQHQNVTARSPEQLMQKITGFSLPIKNLIYWARGLSAPGPNTSKVDQYGHITTLMQQGWRIDYRRYTQANHLDLPQLIDLSRPGLRIRIVIKQWRIQ